MLLNINRFWLARNKKLFDGVFILSVVVGIFKAFSFLLVTLKPVCVIIASIVDDSYPRAYVDGASQGRPRAGGAGGIIHLSSSRSLHFLVGSGYVSKNQAEFAAFKILLRLSLSHGVDRLQVFGDSKLVVDFLKEFKPPLDIFLLPFFEEIGTWGGVMAHS